MNALQRSDIIHRHREAFTATTHYFTETSHYWTDSSEVSHGSYAPKYEEEPGAQHPAHPFLHLGSESQGAHFSHYCIPIQKLPSSLPVTEIITMWLICLNLVCIVSIIHSDYRGPGVAYQVHVNLLGQRIWYFIQRNVSQYPLFDSNHLDCCSSDGTIMNVGLSDHDVQ